MAFKFVAIAALLAVAHAGGPASYDIATATGDHASVAFSQESTQKGYAGQNVLSSYSRAEDTAHSSVRVSSSHASNDALLHQVSYAAPIVKSSYVAPAAYAAPVAHVAQVAPVLSKTAYAAPAYSAYQYGAHAAPVVAKAAYAAPAYPAYQYAAHAAPVLAKAAYATAAYATPVASVSPVLGKAYAASAYEYAAHTPVIAKSTYGYAAHGYAAPIVTKAAYTTPVLTKATYATPVLTKSVEYAAHTTPLLAKTYEYAAHATPVLAKSYAAPYGYETSAPVFHTTFNGLGTSYAW